MKPRCRTSEIGAELRSGPTCPSETCRRSLPSSPARRAAHASGPPTRGRESSSPPGGGCLAPEILSHGLRELRDRPLLPRRLLRAPDVSLRGADLLPARHDLTSDREFPGSIPGGVDQDTPEPLRRIPVSSGRCGSRRPTWDHRGPLPRLRRAPSLRARRLRRGDRSLADLPLRGRRCPPAGSAVRPHVPAQVDPRRDGQAGAARLARALLGPDQRGDPRHGTPDHTRVRKLVAKAFTPRFVESLAPASMRSSRTCSRGWRARESSISSPHWRNRCRSS